jgi:plasmid stability protein
MVWVKADLPSELNKALEVYAAESGLTKEETVRELLKDQLDEYSEVKL